MINLNIGYLFNKHVKIQPIQYSTIIISQSTVGILQCLAQLYLEQQSNTIAIQLYYLSLSILPTPNTCNNLGIY